MNKNFDRENLINYINGDLLYLSNGKGFVCDELEAEEAIKCMNKGEVINLTVNRVVFSRMKLTMDGYIEKKVERKI